jgi:hypothetical protein
MDGLYQSFILLAVPLFIVAANIMNAGTISATGCCGSASPQWAASRADMGHVNVVASLIFSGMSGSAVADAAGIGKIIIEHDDQERPLHPRLCGGDHGGLGDHRADHPAINTDGALCAGFKHIDRVPVFGRHCPWIVHGGCPDGHEYADLDTARLCTGGAGSAARAAAPHGERLSSPVDARHSAVRDLWRRDDPDRGRGRGGAYALLLAACSTGRCRSRRSMEFWWTAHAPRLRSDS